MNRHAPPAKGASSNWYAWTSMMPMTDPARVMSAGAASQSIERILKYGLKRSVCRANQLAPWNRNDVHAPRAPRGCLVGLGLPKQLAQPPLRAIANHGAPEPPRRDDSEPVAVERIAKSKQRHIGRRHASSSLLHDSELRTRAETNRSTKCKRHGIRTRLRPALSKPRIGSSGNHETLATLGPAALQDESAVFRAHSDQEAMGAPASAAIGLERALHETPVSGAKTPRETLMVVVGRPGFQGRRPVW